jgi:hypothetical protein
LDNGENLLLGEGCFVSDCDNEVALGEICHAESIMEENWNWQ